MRHSKGKRKTSGRGPTTTERVTVMLPSQVQHLSAPRLAAYFLGVAALGIAFGAGTNALFGPDGLVGVCAVEFVLLGVVTMKRTKVTLGTDGLLVQWLGWRRFLSYQEIVDLRIEERRFGAEDQVGLWLATVEGPEALLVSRNVDQDAILTIARKVKAAMGRGDEPDALLALSRGRLAPEAWVARLRNASERLSFRRAPLTIDACWAVVEDAQQTVKDRAAAAVVLMGQIGSNGRRRFGSLAKATAHVELREVFRAVSGGDEQKAQDVTVALAKGDSSSDIAGASNDSENSSGRG